MADRPVHEIRLGKIKATISHQAGRKRAPVQRSDCPALQVRERLGVEFILWPRQGLPLVAKVADMVHTWIFQEGTERKAPEQQSSESRDRQRQRPHRDRSEVGTLAAAQLPTRPISALKVSLPVNGSTPHRNARRTRRLKHDSTQLHPDGSSPSARAGIADLLTGISCLRVHPGSRYQ